MLNDYTVFDFETTGLCPVNDRVIEMAALRVVNNTELHAFQCTVNIGRELTDKDVEALQVNGISADEVKNGLPEKVAFAILKNVIGNSLVIAHNAAFDVSFLHNNYIRLGGTGFGNNFLCTRTVAGFRYPRPHKLPDMCNRFNIDLTGAHRAMNDTKATQKLLVAMHAEKDVTEFKNVLGAFRKYGPPSFIPEYATVKYY